MATCTIDCAVCLQPLEIPLKCRREIFHWRCAHIFHKRCGEDLEEEQGLHVRLPRCPVCDARLRVCICNYPGKKVLVPSRDHESGDIVFTAHCSKCNGTRPFRKENPYDRISRIGVAKVAEDRLLNARSLNYPREHRLKARMALL